MRGFIVLFYFYRIRILHKILVKRLLSPQRGASAELAASRDKVYDALRKFLHEAHTHIPALVLICVTLRDACLPVFHSSPLDTSLGSFLHSKYHSHHFTLI